MKNLLLFLMISICNTVFIYAAAPFNPADIQARSLESMLETHSNLGLHRMAWYSLNQERDYLKASQCYQILFKRTSSPQYEKLHKKYSRLSYRHRTPFFPKDDPSNEDWMDVESYEDRTKVINRIQPVPNLSLPNYAPFTSAPLEKLFGSEGN